MEPCRVILIGMMGSGKTTIGRLLTEATGWEYVDNDELVQRHHGATAREILAEHGRERMREAEATALALGLGLPPPVILGVAAGTVLDEGNRERLRAGGTVVWLRATPEILAARARGAAHRPFVETDAVEWMRRTAKEREPLYTEVASLAVDTGTGTPDEAVHRIREHLEAHGC